jgi:hypothetical protein
LTECEKCGNIYGINGNWVNKFMEKYNLRQLFEQIIDISQKIETFTVEELWKWTKFDGINIYLNKTLKLHKYSGTAIDGRKESLNNQIITGDYLLFDYIEHLPEFTIRQYNNFEDLIENIIGERGILNQFTTLQIPIIKGKCKDILFTLKYKNETSFGNKLETKIIKKIRSEIIKICI